MTEKRRQKLQTALDNRQDGIIVIIEDIHDPHNAAAVIRSCDALGVQDVWFVFASQKAYNPRRIGVASSSSANRWLTFRTFTSTKDALNAAKDLGYTSVATVADSSAESIFEYSFPDHTALWFGNEHNGLSDEAQQGCDQKITVPMRGIIQSLNISVTAGMCLFALVRQRLDRKTLKPLTPPARHELAKTWGLED